MTLQRGKEEDDNVFQREKRHIDNIAGFKFMHSIFSNYFARPHYEVSTGLIFSSCRMENKPQPSVFPTIPFYLPTQLCSGELLWQRLVTWSATQLTSDCVSHPRVRFRCTYSPLYMAFPFSLPCLSCLKMLLTASLPGKLLSILRSQCKCLLQSRKDTGDSCPVSIAPATG